MFTFYLYYLLGCLHMSMDKGFLGYQGTNIQNNGKIGIIFQQDSPQQTCFPYKSAISRSLQQGTSNQGHFRGCVFKKKRKKSSESAGRSKITYSLDSQQFRFMIVLIALIAQIALIALVALISQITLIAQIAMIAQIALIALTALISLISMIALIALIALITLISLIALFGADCSDFPDCPDCPKQNGPNKLVLFSQSIQLEHPILEWRSVVLLLCCEFMSRSGYRLGF